MFEEPPSYDAFYLPGDTDFDQAVCVGFEWLMAQPGTPLVVMSAKKSVTNNDVLAGLVRRHGVPVIAPPRVYQSAWDGGAVLGVFIHEKALLAVDQELGHRITAMCVIEWFSGSQSTWVAGHDARDLRTPYAEPAAAPSLDPVVEAAMTEAGDSINHNNALVTGAEKRWSFVLCRFWSGAGTRSRWTILSRGRPETVGTPMRFPTFATMPAGFWLVAPSSCKIRGDQAGPT